MGIAPTPRRERQRRELGGAWPSGGGLGHERSACFTEDKGRLLTSRIQP